MNAKQLQDLAESWASDDRLWKSYPRIRENLLRFGWKVKNSFPSEAKLLQIKSYAQDLENLANICKGRKSELQTEIGQQILAKLQSNV